MIRCLLIILSKNLKLTSIYIYWFYEKLQADGTFDTVFEKCMFGAVKDHESPNPNMIHILQTNTNHYHYHCLTCLHPGYIICIP